MMNRNKTIRMIVGLCCAAGGIGFLVRSNYLSGGMLCFVGIIMFAFAFANKD